MELNHRFLFVAAGEMQKAVDKLLHLFVLHRKMAAR
jgi:hypothetical protein